MLMDAKSAAKDFVSILPFFHVLSEEIPVVSFWLHDRVHLLQRDMVAQNEIDVQKSAPEFRKN